MSHARTALVIGASRGLGLVLVAELARRGWHVVATTRRPGGRLQDLADASGGRVRVETLELTDTDQTYAMRERLADTRLDLLLVNAAIDRGDAPIEDVPVETFTEVMVTNALSPLRCLSILRPLVTADGTVAVMSSDQGSISLNTEPGYELYKASKAALNQLVRSWVTRHAADDHTTLLLDPGHNRTGLGGPDAPLEPEESIPAVVDVVVKRAGSGGLHFLDRHGETVPW